MPTSRRPSVSGSSADEEESRNYLEVQDERQRHLSIASAARATIVASRLLNLSRRRTGSIPHHGRVSHATSQVFKDKAFMDRVKQHDQVGGLEVGHVDVHLPEEKPVHLKGPVEVEVDRHDTQSTFISDRWNPDKASSSDTQAAFLMAVRSIVGLCPFDKIDEFERSCIDLLLAALAPDQATVNEAATSLQNPQQIAKLIRQDMKSRLSQLNSYKNCYATFDSFKSWKRSERSAIAKLMTETDAFAKDTDKFVEAKRKELEAAMNNNNSGEKAEPVKADDEGFCSCCFPKKQPEPPPPRRSDNMGENPRKSSAGLSLIRSRSASSEGSHPFPIPPELGFIWIVVYLLRHLNKTSGVTIRVGSEGIQKQEMNFIWLDDPSLYITDCWYRRYGISDGRRALTLLTFLTGYPQITSKYFWDAIDLYEPLAEAEKSKMLRVDESPELLRLASLTMSWCKACLSAYHDNFNGDIMYKGLGECVRLAILCRHIISTPEQLAQQTDSSYIDKICEIALRARYAFVIEAARTMKDAQIAKQAAATPVHPPARSRSKFGRRPSTGVLIVPSHQEIKQADCRIVSSLHLIYVMQLLQKEIDSDINEFGPVLQSAAGFNAAQETSTLYFPLIWADFKKFLDIQTLLIEEDRTILGNAPESLDPYIFQLYSELRKLYEFFAPHVDLPDINVGEHFAPFVERWLEVQKQQFSSTRVDSAINSDTWLALGDTMCTTSVIDVFALLYPLADAFQHAPFSSAQAVSFAELLSETVKYYVKRLADMLLDDVSEVPGELTEIVALRMNDIHISKVKLSDLLKDINLEKAYGQPPKLTENTTEDSDFTEFLGETIKKSTLDQLQCKQTFKYIQETMESLAYELACSMMGLWAALITELILHKPIDDPMSLDSVEDFLSPLWEDLSNKIEKRAWNHILSRSPLNLS